MIYSHILQVPLVILNKSMDTCDFNVTNETRGRHLTRRLYLGFNSNFWKSTTL